ncbi:MAG: polyprenyl synthetase family protein [Candidatus Marinimicrobia bacterium]|jgi:octaprenyl-diphosphate synthase|nr:polyprenyl synthetase family protein [Candidatus Neomarinimicrobiota bacterium]
MNAELDNIVTSPINDYIIRFEKVYTQSLHSDVKLINTIIRYISRKKGKQLRPRLCLLSAKLCGEPTENTYRAAALIEMIHVATLIHDDVVDDADIRRGWPSVNRVWKNKLSILVGDFMFSKALTNMIHLKDFDALDILSSTAQRLSQGEIQQIEKAIKKNMTEEVYYQMVSDKTASLFSAACKLGVMTVTEDNDKREALAKFGEKFGLVFQIKDDLLDITGNVEGLGKPAGFDLKKNILTLPLIHLFEKLDSSDSKRVKRQIRNHVKKSELKEIRMLIENHGGIQFAEKQIERLSKEAQDELNIFPDSVYKDALLAALQFNSHRNN